MYVCTMFYNTYLASYVPHARMYCLHKTLGNPRYLHEKLERNNVNDLILRKKMNKGWTSREFAW